ncbi:hypothetical protein [Halobiforma nitratireducens]|uniref:Uncharacterized protein n=1 Tax=Halobiforma nitratireducens JCM 10879 TaxID=1227454 RepID=M0L4F3_9EURY|nr:hypothetical protein [Halobiforma nitratireducens]EMA28457.1 hypothetical protein C446_17564 [Halobiforma nitratireducens JCM 10879]
MARRVSEAALTDAVLRDLRRLFLSARGRFFTRPKPPEPAIVVDLTVDEVERLLGEEHFAPNWDLSFAYFGEVCNLRRVEYVADHPLGYRWWQVHVRGYHHPDGIELTAHFETNPSESPDAHVDRVGIDVPRGLKSLRDVLEAHNVPYESIDPTGSPSSSEDERPASSESAVR